MTPHKTLVTGGTRSGKSRYAEGLLADQPRVTYVAPGPKPDPALDPEWAARVAEHQIRRPLSWETVEDTDVAALLRRADGAVLVDSLGTWLSATIDELGEAGGVTLWDLPVREWRADFDDRLQRLVEAWTDAAGPAVAVTDEVGFGLVSEHRSGRVFVDLLGRVNSEIAAASDEVVLMVAGRALRL